VLHNAATVGDWDAVDEADRPTALVWVWEIHRADHLPDIEREMRWWDRQLSDRSA
jgi:hypothetical protein